ncbi:MAG TPA: hypothetical protein VMD77_13370 [Candidatus Baltobacteraceae bacterium]|jgi:hypothetical protein|nr:hypothetical protein [Candidatus Baltobacteraceae bacterium]
MKKFAGLFVLLMLVVVAAAAQDAPPQETPPPDSSSQSTPSTSSSSSQTEPEAGEKQEKKKVSTRYAPKYEIAVGFAHRSYGIAGASKIGMNGWFGSFDYDWKSRIGFVGEAQGVYTTQYPPQAGVEHISLYSLMAGPQIYPFAHHKVTPFGHFLYGEGFYRNSIGPYSPFPSNVVTDFSHSWEGGGGLDWHIKPNWSVRAFQFDYGSTHFFKSNGTGSQGSYRISFGIVYYLGSR